MNFRRINIETEKIRNDLGVHTSAGKIRVVGAEVAENCSFQAVVQSHECEKGTTSQNLEGAQARLSVTVLSGSLN